MDIDQQNNGDTTEETNAQKINNDLSEKEGK